MIIGLLLVSNQLLASSILKDSSDESKIISSSDIYMDVGKCYEDIGSYKKAEEYWLRASNMVPSQFNPKYLIAKMYLENGKKEKAKKMASQLLQKKRKVYSIEVHEILEELKMIVKEDDEKVIKENDE